MSLFEDFCTFARAQIESGDIDPMYPLLRASYEDEALEEEIALWRTLLYVTWYHLGTANRMWQRAPEPRPLTEDEVNGLPTGVERRGFRGNVLAVRFVNGVLDAAPVGLSAWVRSLGDGESGWDRVRSELQMVSFAGPWASYKWADLLKNVHGLPLRASDIGVGGKGEKTGPIPGMVRLTGEPWQECANNVGLQRDLLKRGLAAGVPFGGLDQLETALCDFNSLCKGTYYVGHDIDVQQEHLKGQRNDLWRARRVFRSKYRGELSGWNGVRPELKVVYRDRGEVLT